MSTELRDLLRGIVEQQDLIRAWTVEVGPGGSSLRAQTRHTFDNPDSALRAAQVLMGELVRNSPREVRAAVPGTTPHHAQEWRGVVDVELGPF